MRGLNEPIPARVALLLDPGGPPNVSRSIRPVVVHPVQRVSGAWPRAHIRQEVLERGIPPITHVNAASAVGFVSWEVWILASLSHVPPKCVFRGSGATVRSRPLANRINQKTPAALRISADEVGLTNRLGRPAIAHDIPSAELRSNLFGLANHQKAAKSEAGQLSSFSTNTSHIAMYREPFKGARIHQ